jgi:L-threonylcarbamoyladenylate synthase
MRSRKRRSPACTGLKRDQRICPFLCCYLTQKLWKRSAELFWPGGLSLILRRSPAVPDVVTAGGPTVAVRVPDHAFVRELCRLLEAPLAATSANLHGQPPPITADGVEETLGGQIPLLLDGGTCSGGIASTVLDLTVWPPAILRHGPVTALQLAAIMPLAGGPNGSSA